MSEQHILDALQPPLPAESLDLDLPIAAVAAKSPPAPLLHYRNRELEQIIPQPALSELPIVFRVVRILPWLLIALLMLGRAVVLLRRFAAG